MNLDIVGLTVRYGARIAVQDLALTLHPGEILALLGANGSGKTSVLRALAGLTPHTGTARWSSPPRIGYMPQDSAANAALTVFEVVLLGRMRSLRFRPDAADLAAAETTLREIGLHDLAERRIGELSGGQRQMVFLAQVLAADPHALLLDEPTSALDIAHQLRILELLRAVTRRRGLTTLVVMHDLNAAARFADRVALLHRGGLIGVGAPADILRAETLEPVFGARVAVLPGPDGVPVVVPLGAATQAGEKIAPS